MIIITAAAASQPYRCWICIWNTWCIMGFPRCYPHKLL